MAKEQTLRAGTFWSNKLVQRARLISGLTLMTYATSHFINHAFGHISIEAMDAMLHWQSLVWQSTLGSIALYGGFTIHLALGLAKIGSLNTYRLPVWQWAQILLGLAIPFWLASHIVYTRFAENELGLDVTYGQELALIWTGAEVRQSLLIGFVWLHGCIGIHFWLRTKSGYPQWQPYLFGLAALIPTLSLTGFIAAARRQADAHQATLQQIAGGIASEEQIANAEQRQAIISYFIRELSAYDALAKSMVMWVGIALAVILVVRYLLSRTKQRVPVSYGDGVRVMAVPGTSLLDVSRQANIPHMSVCGGRARCSTCRTLITEGTENLSPPEPAELELLSRLNAPPNVRLACQAKLSGRVDMRPLIQPQHNRSIDRTDDPLGWGVERQIVVFFLDIRGFSKISEKSLPYDVVFILNSFFDEVAAEIEAVDGYVDKFMGDGLMALFGLSSDPKSACRNALKAALRANRASDRVSRVLTQHIQEPIRIGIGIHVGNAVVGRIGRTADQASVSRLTAIGDTVNIAARLEAANKELHSTLVFSKAVAQTAELEIPAELGTEAEIEVHNITKPIEVFSIETVAGLEFLDRDP